MAEQDQVQFGKIKSQIEEFKRKTNDTTDRRARLFKNLVSFVMDGEQWSSNEVKERAGDGFSSLAFNFSEDYVERYLARLFPRNPRTGVMEVGTKVFEDEKGQQLQQILDTYKNNDFSAILLEQGTDFLVGGAGCLYYPQDPVTGETSIISLDPTTVHLGWSGKKLVQFMYIEKFDDNSEKWTYWDLRKIVVIHGDKMTIKDHKMNFIPFSWIPSFPKPHTREGRSKVLSLYDLDREFNSVTSDFSKRIGDNTDPHLAVFSDDVAIDKVARGRKKKTLLGKDDDMRYLELKEGTEILDYTKDLEKIMRRKTGIIDSAGTVKSAVSGFSLAFQFSDMLDLIGFMRIFWDNAFREMNNAILTYKFGVGEYKTDPVYHPAIMFDSKQRVEEYQIMLEQSLISKKDAIDELRGVENAEKKLKEIVEENKLFVKEKSNDNGNGRE